MDLVTAALHGAVIILLFTLLFIYAQNYRKVRSRYTLGLLIFVVLFLFQSFLQIYFDVSMVMYSSQDAEQAAFILEILKTCGLAILVWISWE